jgi:acyl carrier protein
MSTPPETAETTGTDTRCHIAALFTRVLKVADVRDDDDFFTLGGSSLSAIELLDAIADELAVELPVGDFYQSTSVTELARAVDACRAGSAERKR